jgi:hypothetical protein
MHRLLALLVVPTLTATATAAPVAKDPAKFICVDLQPYGNKEVKKTVGEEENFLTGLTEGEKTFENVRFKVGVKFMSLGSKLVEDGPAKIEGIKVDAKCAKVHMLHATQFGGGPNVEGGVGHEKDGTTIGEYKITFEDKSTDSIPIVYGNDVRDWWYADDEKDPLRSKVVWRSENALSKSRGSKIRLYATVWANSKVDQKIVKIDYNSRKDSTPCAPFCLAISLQEK